ncbi:sensor histidine kinase [Virgisporangium aurantiacum]|uniref:histidine kinase n=1 Tax=Virgisporangium aurantiacum TaxID=175570 RepID=A0A8J3Z0E4_9ACTN|nr:sensor histidine kinase [Virgisporangium aurantiacum]GIJ54137.1 ATPase [Virgisporangium aurantiacum]
MRRRFSLAGQLLLSQLGIVLAVVVAVGAVSLAEADAAFRTDEGRRLRSVAENLAAESTVRAGITDPLWYDALAARAESARAVAGATYVVIGDRAGVLVTGPGAGRPADLGDSDVLRGRAWVGVLDDGARRLVAHVPVLAESNGEIVGFVVVGLTYPTFAGQLANATPGLLVYLTLGLVLGVAGSLLLARRVKRQTLGLEPTEITGLVEHREAMLHGIKEGVIGTDAADRVTLANDEAVRLLGLPPDAVGRPLTELGLADGVFDVLTGRTAGADQVVLRDDRVLVLNRMPVIVRGRDVGSVTTLRDRTELTALRRELDVSRLATDTLRAQAHEFTNRLHTIAGLVELGEYDEVVRYVDGTSRRHESLRDVTSRISDPALAALLVAKASLAAERGVDLRIDPAAAIGPLDEELAADLVTVVGNLVDNAIDAAGPGGWVSVSITDGDGVVIRVRDSGPGVAPAQADEVFRQGFSTKDAAGTRGFGLALTRSICVRRGGSATVDGSAFTAVVPRVRAAAR